MDSNRFVVWPALVWKIWAAGVSIGLLTSCRASGAGEPPPVPGESVSYTFEKFEPGALPTTWDACAVGNNVAIEAAAGGPKAGWSVSTAAKAASGARVLAHAGSGSSVAWLRGGEYGDVKLSAAIRVRANGESGDAAIAWRVAGPGDFLALRFSGKTRMLQIQSFKNGAPSTLAECAFEAPRDKWVSLSVEQSGERIRCGASGAILLEARDGGDRRAGSAGFCCFDGTAAEFDNFSLIGDRVR
jgi:hypothetical protein